jgi:hypothetical protein
MKTSKILVAFVLAIALLSTQVGVVIAAPVSEAAILIGKVTEVTLETDANTAVTTVLVKISDENGNSQSFRISQQTALDLGILIPDINGGIPVINPDVFELTIQIDPKTVISDNEADRHPVGDALATFFSDTINIDYDTIMKAHEEGVGLCKGSTGFGVIAQALWLTQKLKEEFEMDTSELFCAILLAKETGNYGKFVLEDGSTPKNWGQFRKAVLDGDKKGNLGIVMSDKDKDKSKNANNGDNNGNEGNGNGNNGNGNRGNDGKNGNSNNDTGNNGNGKNK